LGRIDFETTANIGIISGGIATNIVPENCKIKGEVRSHGQAKLTAVTEEIIKVFRETVKKHHVEGTYADVIIKAETCYNAFRIFEDNPLVALAEKTTTQIGLPFKTNIGGGGSDANIFNGKGITTVLVGTGMNEVHTKKEYISKTSLIKGAEWVTELLKNYSKE